MAREAGDVRWRALLPFLTLLVAGATVAGSLWWTDDAFPFAPFRMFSHANDPDGVVRSMRFEAELASGERIRLEASAVGLRRAELEEQTPANRRVPDDRLAALAEVYNGRNKDPIVHLQVVVHRVDLVGGVPQPDPTVTVIGDWAVEGWTGARVEVDLPPAGPWRGHG